MSQQQQKVRDNFGSIRKNDRKYEEKHPDYRGKCTIGGESYWISGWKKQSEDGDTWLSLAFSPVNK